MLNHLAPTVRKRMARLTRYRRKLAASIRKRTARLLWPDGHGVVRRDGALFLLDLNNWYDKVILKWGPGEPEQRLYLLDNIRQRECETFLDVGANFGTYAAFVALCTKATTIIAYEPDRRSYDRLRTHLLLNRVHKKVETRMAAVSNRNGMVPFIRAPDDNDSLSKVGEDGSDNYSVHAVRLDDELPLTGHRIALKVDVEGHELSALEGMKSLLRANDCFLQVECWKENAACFIDAMKAEGYGLLHQIEQDHYFAKEG